MKLNWWQRILVNAVIFLALAGLISGFYVESIFVAIGASLVLGLLNVFIKPILVLLSLPITILTFGFFSVIINALILNLTSVFVGSGFQFSSFGTALLVTILMSFVNAVLSTWLFDK